ncbi:ABC transporter substrate-binding protein [Paeniglutamicibacter sp.]|uniref:ABC transporter substrate-binding protein n=1 Tax=Paeniglutamicibacter sp. TaxID=1934391 RepID=UPI003988C04C
MNEKIRRLMRKGPITAGALMAVSAIALTACTTGSPTGGANSSGSPSTDTIRTVFTADPSTFSPFKVNAIDDYTASRFLFDTLVRRGADNQIVSGLASKWEIIPTKGVFTLRDGATCSDGTAIPPQVVSDSLNYFASKDAGSTFRVLVFGEGEAKISADAAVGTVTVDLAQPWTDMLQGLSLAGSGIVCPEGLKDQKGLAAGTAKGAFSGPYTLAKKAHGVNYQFALRTDYKAWPAYDPAPAGTPAKSIEASVNANSSAITNELLTGSRDYARISGKDMTRFKDQQGYGAEVYAQASTYIVFNERPGSPFASADARKAVAQAVNRDAYNHATGGGLGQTYSSFARPGVACANEEQAMLIPEDSAAAKTSLAGIKIKMVGANAFGPNGAGNTYVSEALRAAGADVELRNVDVANWATDLQQNPEAWDMTIYGALNPSGTMYAALSPIAGVPVESGGLNVTGNANQPVMDLVAQAMAETDDTKRCTTYEAVQENIIGEAHAVPLASLPAQSTTRPGFGVSIFNGSVDESTLRVTN